MKFRQCMIIFSIIFLAGFAQLASAQNGPGVTLNNQLGNDSYLVMNYDVIQTEEDIANIETLGRLVSYQKTKVFNDFTKMDTFSFAKKAASYPTYNGNYIYAGIGSKMLTPDGSCQNFVARINSNTKHMTITVKKSLESPTEISCSITWN